MNRAYADRTRVSERQTRSDIESELSKHDCEKIGVMIDPTNVCFAFMKKGRCYRIDIDLPTAGTHSDNSERRRRMRTLFLYIKGRLNAVRDGIKTFEQEFLVETVVGDGQTIGSHATRQIEHVESQGSMPTTLLLTGG